jgi:RNA polymerase sigma-70 factor (ECF subfamily)
MKKNKNKLPDNVLIEMCKNGNSMAEEYIIRRYYKKVFGYILNLVKDRELAEDILHDTFVKVIKKIRDGNYEEKGIFNRWLVRIAHNLCLDNLRRDKRSPIVCSLSVPVLIKINGRYLFILDFPDENNNIEEDIIDEESMEYALAVIDKLPKEQKEIFDLRIFKGIGFKEIKENTGININTALARMRYARMNIEKMKEGTYKVPPKNKKKRMHNKALAS